MLHQCYFWGVFHTCELPRLFVALSLICVWLGHPTDCSTVLHYLPEFAQTRVHKFEPTEASTHVYPSAPATLVSSNEPSPNPELATSVSLSPVGGTPVIVFFTPLQRRDRQDRKAPWRCNYKRLEEAGRILDPLPESLALPIPWFQMFILQNDGGIHFCCVSPQLVALGYCSPRIHTSHE